MSLVTYNGVTLPYALMSEFRQEAVYDDTSGTDLCLTKFDFQCQATVNANYLDSVLPGILFSSTPNAATIMDLIRSRLMAPRKALTVSFNGVNLIQKVGNNPGSVDSANGPKPQSCVITQLNNVTFLVNYHMVAQYWERIAGVEDMNTATNNLPGNVVVSCRWSETVDIDHCNYTKRTREGKVMIRSDNSGGLIADYVREKFAVVSVPKGFLRESSNYSVAPDGLALTFRVIDKEVFKKPPKPAFEASGHYLESVSRGGAKRYGEVYVRLKGDKITSQAALLQLAINVGMSKLNINGARNILEMSDVRVEMYENVVEFRARMMYKPGKKGTANVRIKGCAGFDAGTEMTFTPYTDDAPFYKPNYDPRGTAGYLMQAAAYYDPSNPAIVVQPRNDQLSAGREVGQAGVNP